MQNKCKKMQVAHSPPLRTKRRPTTRGPECLSGVRTGVVPRRVAEWRVPGAGTVAGHRVGAGMGVWPLARRGAALPGVQHALQVAPQLAVKLPLPNHSSHASWARPFCIDPWEREVPGQPGENPPSHEKLLALPARGDPSGVVPSFAKLQPAIRQKNKCAPSQSSFFFFVPFILLDKGSLSR